MKKKLLMSILMLASVFCLAIGLTACGESNPSDVEEKDPTDGVIYELSATGNYYIVTGYTGDSSEVVIASTYNKLPVTKIQEKAFYNYSDYTSTVTNIIVPNSVTSIGEGAFQKCYSLVSITLPFVGGNASFSTPSAVTLFGYIFGTESYIGGTATTQQYTSSDSETYYIPTALRSVTITGGNLLYGSFYNCGLLTNVSIPNSMTAIGEYAFYNCNTLESINIPDGLTTIEDHTFYCCSSLSEITIPSNVTTIGGYAFYGCSSLTEITIPKKVTTIGDSAFYGCSSVTEIKYNATSLDDLTSSYAFGYVGNTDSKTTVIIGSNVEKIPANLFRQPYYMSYITSIVFEDNSVCKSIGNDAFFCCRSLENITIPNSVTSIGSDAFYVCSSLTSVIFENTSGWYRTTTEGSTVGIGISSTDLDDSATAATYLTSTYYSYYWYRNE